VDKAAERARDIGAQCLQLFVKSPSQWRFAALDDATVARFRATAAGADLHPLIGHASYLVNLASPDGDLYAKSRACVLEEWDRAERLGLVGLVLHPGSHTASGEAAGLRRIARALDWLHRRRPDAACRILIETTAGAGSMLCGQMGHLAAVLDACEAAPRLGVCIDTCHLWAAGYDVASADGLDETLAALDSAAGLARLACVHANDAKGERGSHLDRHEHIGRGRIGRDGFRRMLRHPALRGLPWILETPKHDARGRAMDPINLRTLRRLAEEG
jgi:deoxyribonuclease-4